MYLKSIEVQGFKSFANKITFEFHNGITAIVGPNGSGKSNVADAVRWVLGEQKVKQLRSSNMQDVIFSGTEVRKPQGFAYVAITLDNTRHELPIDFDEVKVSRRIYRSGESEYLLNGSACRLKDIHELFYDTGIGKEGYSIIGQGQIDKVLSGRPEERRELFDEAAGIVKFKRRKLIAQKKMEDEKQNLVRVRDILGELEKQVGPLEKQAITAKEYLRLRDELKYYDANLFLVEIASVQERVSELLDKEKIVIGDMEESKQQFEQFKKEYDQLSQAMQILDDEISTYQALAAEAQMEKGNLEGQINVIHEQIRAEERNVEYIQNRIGSIAQELAEKEEQKAKYKAEKAELTVQISSVKEMLFHAEEELTEVAVRADGLEQMLEEEQNIRLDALNEKSTLSVKKQRFDTLLEQMQVRRSEAAQKLLKIHCEEEAWDTKIQECQNSLFQVDTEITRLLQMADQLELEEKTASNAINTLNKELSSVHQEYHTSKTKLESLRNLAERYEGYGNSIRRVMECREQIHGIHGVVADLIDVPKQYEIAVETALGGSIQNIVTDTDQTAKVLIEYLKRHKYGRATFLPLTNISGHGSFEPKQALQEPGVIGIASELIQEAPTYLELVRYLLGRVLVVDDIDHALVIAKKYRHSIRIVTLEGELLNPGGSLSGGAFKNSSNLLGRKREMEQLERVCQNTRIRIDEIQQELERQEQVQDEKMQEFSRITKELQGKYLEENTYKVSLEQLIKKKEELLESSKDLMLEHQKLEEQLSEMHTDVQKIITEMGVLEKNQDNRNARILELGTELETAKVEREQASKKFSDIQVKVAGLNQQELFLDEHLKRICEEEQRLHDEKATLISGSGLSEAVVKDRAAKIEELRQDIEQQQTRAAYHKEQEEAARKQKEQKVKEQRRFFEKREELSERISRLDKELFRFQNQKEKQEEQRDMLVDYIWTEYELTYSTAEMFRDSSLVSISELKAQIAERKNAIRELGHVNIHAIEDFKEISERYLFMKTQHDDLLTAQEALFKIIEELDVGMRKQFAEKFGQIQAEFNRVFKELFGGGHSTLEMVDDMDILEAGIQIIAQPPGKKLQNMMQMSGGEKALTAIALLFAIQNLKPSPFCLLDEIEAALDDSNVDRYAKYLHKLTKHTQFIVITHRRGTMVAADRLYGITMQEKGVSTLVSVNLIENDLK